MNRHLLRGMSIAAQAGRHRCSILSNEEKSLFLLSASISALFDNFISFIKWNKVFGLVEHTNKSRQFVSICLRTPKSVNITRCGAVSTNAAEVICKNPSG